MKMSSPRIAHPFHNLQVNRFSPCAMVWHDRYIPVVETMRNMMPPVSQKLRLLTESWSVKCRNFFKRVLTSEYTESVKPGDGMRKTEWKAVRASTFVRFQRWRPIQFEVRNRNMARVWERTVNNASIYGIIRNVDHNVKYICSCTHQYRPWQNISLKDASGNI